MNIQIAPLSLEHLDRLRVLPTLDVRVIDPDLRAVALLVDQPYNFTALVDGQVVACAGLCPVSPGRAFGWALFDCRAERRHMLALTRQARRMLDQARADGLRRVDASVIAGFAAGERWLTLLGFSPYHVAQGYGPRGEAHRLFERVLA